MSDSLNRSILLAARDGRASAFSPEELMTMRVNSWLGWQCAAGFDNIHIGPGGHITAAACGIESFYGNVYEGPLHFPKDWLTCSVKWCMCGADMRLRKARNKVLRSDWDKTTAAIADSLTREMQPSLQKPADADCVMSVHLDESKRYPKTVSWDVSKRCNYKCSYCHPKISNQTDPLRSRDEVFSAAFKIMREFAFGQRVSWVFTGGEPTLHPFFNELCEMLYKKQHVVHTQTNGSRLPDYYAELIRWSCIGISVHLEFADPQKIVDVARAVILKKASDTSANQHWFGIRIMVPPGDLPKAQSLLNSLRGLSNFLKYATVFMSTTYEKEERDQLMQYPESELDSILQQS